MAKYNVGDKVVVKSDLEGGNRYGGLYFSTEMEKYRGKTTTISYVGNGFSEDRYRLKCDRYNHVWFSNEMIEEKKSPVRVGGEDLSGVFDKINDTLVNLADKINNRTLYDDAIIGKVQEKVESISVEELKKNIYQSVDNYIKSTFGVLPKRIEVARDNVPNKQLTGLFHKKFKEILDIVNKGVPLMLTGPAGAGKNHTLEQVAQALDLDFYFTNAVTQEYKLMGFVDANGTYQETPFYKAYKNGGLFFFDEIDASCPDSLIVINAAIANGYCDFPNGTIKANENFRVVCAGNTFGTGADMVYVGRNALDGATLDRFAVIEFDYDEDIEKQLAYDDSLYKFIVALRKAIKDCSLRYIVSMRATINATKLLQIGMDKKDILKSVILKNMQIDDLNTIVKKINNSGEWYQCLKEVMNNASSI